MTKTGANTSGNQRIQTSLLSGVEKKLLLWIAPRLPRWVSPDLLTFIGLLGLAIAGLGYYLSLRHWLFLVLASFGLLVNWFGDSLDGTVARVRNMQRPKYGYYLDHLVDAFGVALMIFGLAYSGLVSQPFVWLILALFFIASINTYLATNSVQVFKISYLRVSTTEARVVLIILNTWLIWVKKIRLFGFTGYFLDYISALISLFFFVIIVRSAYRNLRKLDREERSNWQTPAPEKKE